MFSLIGVASRGGQLGFRFGLGLRFDFLPPFYSLLDLPGPRIQEINQKY
jgi:hypothetical protein